MFRLVGSGPTLGCPTVLAFWGAVLLPLLYLPSLAYWLIAPMVAIMALFLDLVVAQGSIILGHGHTPFWSR